MSYQRLNHNNPSVQGRQNSIRSRSSSLRHATESEPQSESTSESDSNADVYLEERKYLHGEYELEDLSTPLSGTIGPSSYYNRNGVNRSRSIDDNEEDDDRIYVERGRRGSASTTHSFSLYTPDEERVVVKKFDRNLVVFVACLYMLSFLDRSSMVVYRYCQ